MRLATISFQRWAALLLVYLLVDLSSPLMPGAASDPGDCVDGVHISRPHAESPVKSIHPQPGFTPIMDPHETFRATALLARASAPARPLLSIRCARSGPSEPSGSAEDH